MEGIFLGVLITLILPGVVLADVSSDFGAHCAKCHGGNAKTNLRRALMLKLDPKKMYLPASEMNKEQMTAVIEKGRNKMPGFGDILSADHIKGLVDYVWDMKVKK
ncbi:MAG TPA: cytochrome c [Thermodesulfobacteriota bacterium]|nr:cytochrome c [Thermodesulfobacteriota bacterium]